MNVKNTFINFTADAKQSSSFMRQSTEPVPTIPKAPDTPTNAARPGTLELGQPAMWPMPPMMGQDLQRQATAECSEDGSDLEFEPGAFMPQVTEYEFGLRPQATPTQSLFGLLPPTTNWGMTGAMPGIMPVGIPTNMHMAMPRAVTGVGGEWAGKTSVMLRNLPCDYTQQTLLAEVNQSGFAGTFGFFYLPIDKGTGGNKGYAFLDFSDAAVAWQFKLAYDGRTMVQFNSDKLVSVMPAALQGFDANFAHYENSRVKRGDPTCRPLFFRNPVTEALGAFGRASPPVTLKTDIRRKGPGRLEQRVEMQRREELIQQAVQQLASSVVQQQAEKREQPTTGEGMPRHFCSSCGFKIKPNFQFCPSCGTGLTS